MAHGEGVDRSDCSTFVHLASDCLSSSFYVSETVPELSHYSLKNLLFQIGWRCRNNPIGCSRNLLWINTSTCRVEGARVLCKI